MSEATASNGQSNMKTHMETQPEAEPVHLATRMGTTGLVLTVMAYLAPLSGTAGFVTLVIGYGNGLGAPLTFPAAGLVLLVFSVGYTAMVHAAAPARSVLRLHLRGAR